MIADDDNEFTDDQELVFDWKKKGFDNRERLTLKNDAKEAEAFNARKNNRSNKKFDLKPQNLPLGLKQLRKKVREVYDDDEDEENGTIFAPLPFLQEEDNTLLNALTDDEKRLFKQKNTIENTQMQQTAGKMEALQIANNLAKEAGLNKISRKAVELGMQQAVFRPEEIQQKVIKKDVAGKLGIKGKIEDGKIIQAARGIKRVEQLGGKKAAKNLDMRDIVKAGEEKLDDIKLAELILEKSGQDVSKRKAKFQEGKEKIQLKNFDKSKTKSKVSAGKKRNLHLARD